MGLGYYYSGNCSVVSTYICIYSQSHNVITIIVGIPKYCYTVSPISILISLAT